MPATEVITILQAQTQNYNAQIILWALRQCFGRSFKN